MTEHAREAGRQRTPFLAALRHRLWEVPTRRREAERRRKEEQTRAEERTQNQLLAASLPTVLLALLSRGDAYGYGIVRKLERAGLELTRETLVYPALGRLEVDGLLEGYAVVTPEGPRRKYYRLLPAGAAALEESLTEWRTTIRTIDALLPEREGR